MKERDCIENSDTKISIIMTTYNGEKYLKGQLLSIENQTIKADEVLIFDDCSTDSTVEIIKDFIKEYKPKNWYLYINKNNLGWKRNFIQGILKAKGKIIFLSDQDDIWFVNKIEKMVMVMDKYENIQVLSCNIRVIYNDNTQPKIRRSAKKYKIKRLEKVQLNGSTYRPIRPGCAYAFSKDILPDIKRLWFDDIAHDSLIWSIGLMRGTLYILNEALMYQVRHEGNNTPSNEKTCRRRIELIKFRKELSLHLLGNMQDILEENKIWIRQYINAAEERLVFLKKGGIISYLALLRYVKYYPKLESWIGDYIAFLNKG
ncbi:glycosyltransferase [bacterium D16-54]|nr:glycosyltransferase [bacterium D16-54]RKJ12711.1 glycosyltransferase [bacterium D16-56]